MLGCAIVIGWFIVLSTGKNHIPPSQLKKLMLVSTVCALVGARLLAIATTFHALDFSNPLHLLIPGHTGLVAYGGFLGGFLGALYFTRKHQISLFTFADATTPALAVGLGLTRIGCFLYGCDYGKPISPHAPEWIQQLGVHFPNWHQRFGDVDSFSNHAALQHGSPAFLHHVHEGFITSGASQSLLVFPAQPIASLNGVIALGLIFAFKKKFTYNGQMFIFFIVYYGLTRFAIECIRGDLGRGVLFTLTTSQWIALFSVATALVAHIKLRAANKRPTPNL